MKIVIIRLKIKALYRAMDRHGAKMEKLAMYTGAVTPVAINTFEKYVGLGLALLCVKFCRKRYYKHQRAYNKVRRQIHKNIDALKKEMRVAVMDLVR